MFTISASTPSGTMTVARGRGFRRSAVKDMMQQMHNSNIMGKAEQMTMVNVSGGSFIGHLNLNQIKMCA